MASTFIRTLLAVIYFGLLADASAQTKDGKLIVNIAVAPWSPFVGTSPKEPGILEKYLERRFSSNASLRLNFVYLDDWEAALNEVSKETYHATLPWLFVDERLRGFNYSTEPIMEDHTVLFCLKSKVAELHSQIGRSMEKMASFRIGIIKGYTPWNKEQLSEFNYDNYVLFNDFEEGLVGLKENRADFLAENLIVGLFAINRQLRRRNELEKTRSEFSFMPFEPTFGIQVRPQPMYILTSRHLGRSYLLDKIDNHISATGGEPLLSRDWNGLQYLFPEEIIVEDQQEMISYSGGVQPGPQRVIPRGSKGIALQWLNGNTNAEVLITTGPVAGCIVRLAADSLRILGHSPTEQMFKP